MFNIGFSELILILLVAFVIVGPADLPKVARGLGRAVRYVRKMFDDFKEEAGLDETIREFKGIKRDLKDTVRDVDPTKDLRDAKEQAEQSVRDAKQAATDSGASNKATL